MKFARTMVMLLVAAAPAWAQAGASPAGDPKAQALYEFMMARRLESSGDAAGALASLERARKLDPESGEISAEIAGYYSRQNRGPEAVAAAEQALKLDKDNVEAHNILGTIYSAWSEGAVPPPPGQTAASARDAAIQHLTAIQGTPLMAYSLCPDLNISRLSVTSE